MNKKEKAFLRALPHADSRYFAELSARISAPRAFAAKQKGKAFDMEKHERHITIRRAVIGTLLAAAVLGGGGIAATVAMRGHDGGIVAEESRDIRSMIEERDVNSKPVLHLLPDDGREPDMFLAPSTSLYGWALPYAETDDGWYYYRTQETLIYDTTSDGGHSTTENISEYYCFKSKETGEVVPLCARANCLHDGNEYCEASTKRYVDGSLFVMDGKLCRLAYRIDANGTRQGAYLLTYAPNGTGIEETAELDPNTRADFFCVFRGYLFYITDEWKEYSNADTGVSYRQDGWALCCYEPSTGKNYRLYEHIPTGEKTVYYAIPQKILGIGDDIFIFCRNETNRLNGGIFRINLLTLESEQIDKNAVINADRVLATRKEIVYMDSYSIHNAVGKRYDIAKHELTEGITELREAWNDAGAFLTNMLIDSGYTVWAKKVWNKETLKWENNIYIGDDKGNLLTQADISPLGDADFIMLKDGWLYLRTNTEHNWFQTVYNERGDVIDTVLNTDADLNCYLLRVKLSDFADGKTDPNEWEKLLTLTEKTAKAGYIDWAHEEND